jgi:hypothetical protein
MMDKKRGRPKGEPKVVVYCRVAPDTIAALDRLCQAMRPVPTRAQLIDAALAEYVERHDPGRGKGAK